MSTLWVIAALVVVATLIGSLYSDAARSNFERLLTAHLFSLVGAVSVSTEGVLQGRPELGELRYSSPLSGWYWSVDPLAPNVSGKLESPSLIGRIVPEMPITQAPFDSSFMRSYSLPGLNGEELFIVETEVVLDNAGRVARFRVMGNLSEVMNEISDFRTKLAAYLAVFGIGSILINAAIILFGLRPLDKVRQALTDIREGRSSKLDASLPMEIAPLAREMNALIENNRRIVERSRTQVGNLAHSLKTPLSVLVNEGRAIGGDQGRVVQEQSEAMQVQIQHYLQRARIAAQRDSVVFRTSVAPVMERMQRVTAKLNPALHVSLRNDLPHAIFAGEKEDLEEIIGNLLENAGKWASRRVNITVGAAMGGQRQFEIVIEDDGPGLEDDKIEAALKRGSRVDETKPGTGLGLAIVQDTVREYGGQLHLDRSPLGGLRVRSVLPLAED
ncbi:MULTISPECIES: ATP-binding protein [Brucella/Ochrobactrum group]|uniref:histidine kinase n=1 Tax=Ochrobactrum teleogrylli TaxID=2479765 RepID=A0ABD5JZB7_9HYPH|nr:MULTISPECIES: ATP-binding protein [Brucella]MDX4074736.1 ATP-binding protein [Brucella sp. NBRC 113783]WHS30667.1 ATP-binding protein [Brucella sp. NM4]WHT42870.1 ATP-binding protein [Ochrobactrum sp. SSR]